MDIALRDKFLALWKKYFNQAELPITFYYTDKITDAKPAGSESLPRCIIGALASIREGKSFYFDAESLKCGQRFLGFSSEIRPTFRYFLSCGIPGKMDGERYKKSPELVKEAMKLWPVPKAPARFIIFKNPDHFRLPAFLGIYSSQAGSSSFC